MPEEKDLRGFEQPMKVQTVNPETVQCKDCVFRDKTIFEHKGKTLNIGVVKAYCEVYRKDKTNGKPTGVLFETAECKYYMKDEGE